MTTEIAVMNRIAIALAADSAITIGNGQKFYNNANKIFMLSKVAPIGVMMYNNAEFMGVPLETLIKEFRKRLRNVAYSTVEEYWDSFIKFLNSPPDSIKSCYHDGVLNEINTCMRVFDRSSKRYIQKNGSGDVTGNIEDYLKTLFDEFFDDVVRESKDWGYIECVKSIRKNELKPYKHFIEKYVDQYSPFTHRSKSKLRIQIESLILNYLKSDKSDSFTGVVIAGFGDDELFPAVVSGRLYGILFNDILKMEQETNCIGRQTSASVMPFAQGDVISTFMTGLHPDYYNLINDAFEESLSGKKCEDAKSCVDEARKHILANIKKHSEKNHIDEILEVVRAAPKEELSLMAETLVNLTSFRRKMSMDTMSQSVGGPIDVALITKGDGFVWIKRKHYFHKDINHNFFENYNADLRNSRKDGGELNDCEGD